MALGAKKTTTAQTVLFVFGRGDTREGTEFLAVSKGGLRRLHLADADPQPHHFLGRLAPRRRLKRRIEVDRFPRVSGATVLIEPVPPLREHPLYPR